MGSIEEAYKSYITGDLSMISHSIPDESFLLIHGSFGNPVQLQQSMKLAKALTRAETKFEQKVKETTTFYFSQNFYF